MKSLIHVSLAGVMLLAAAPAYAESTHYYMDPVAIGPSSELVASYVNNCRSSSYLVITMTNCLTGETMLKTKKKVKRGKGAEFSYPGTEAASVYAKVKVSCGNDAKPTGKYTPYIAATVRDTDSKVGQMSVPFTKVKN